MAREELGRLNKTLSAGSTIAPGEELAELLRRASDIDEASDLLGTVAEEQELLLVWWD